MTRQEVIDEIRRKGIKPGQVVLKAWFLKEPEMKPVLALLESLVAEGLLDPKGHDYVLKLPV